jgi:beta-glucosidase
MPAKRLLLFCAALLVTIFIIISWKKAKPNVVSKEVYDHSSVIITIDGNSFRDLNKNGKLDVYEDSKQPIEARINDLLKQMTLEEKAGMMFINGAKVNEDGSIEDKPATGLFAFVPNGIKLMKEKQMNHFNLWVVPSTSSLAKWYNSMQKFAEDSTRLGIPITIASDPRNHFSNQIFAMAASGFSQWCNHWDWQL